MTLLVKICGLSTRETLDVALAAGADMVGFVFFPPSPRNISLEAARALGLRVKDRAKTVALVVDADDALLEQIIGVPAMKVLAIETKADLAAIAPYAGVADRLLFDALPPRDATRPGGLGKPFDWHLLEGLDLPVPYMLSGGLDPDNVAEALRITRAPGVDVSSGIESAPGIKDPDKIRAFIRAARASLGAGMPVG